MAGSIGEIERIAPLYFSYFMLICLPIFTDFCRGHGEIAGFPGGVCGSSPFFLVSFFMSFVAPFTLGPGVRLAGCSDTCCAFLSDGWTDLSCFTGC
jgi:hypothetical protein